jgi:predicted metal-dependent phosphoesterase TrpH
VTFILDLHVHTRVGSGDSRIDDHELAGLPARRAALHGLVLTEHERRWSPEEFATLPGRLFAINARELTTRLGHILVLGVPDEALVAVREPGALRATADAHGGLLILAHPFRHYPSSWSLLFPQSQDWWREHHLREWPPERLAEHPAFALVDAVEVLNGGTLRHQNELARKVAAIRGLAMVGGSDAHDFSDIGYHATRFASAMTSEGEVIATIRAGACEPVERTRAGRYAPPVAGPEGDG